MRKIKFRGRTKEGGRWVYGQYAQGVPLSTYYDIVEDIISAVVDGKLVKYIINPDTVGEFTGTIDINGTEIYEHDVVYAPNKNSYYRVKYGKYQDAQEKYNYGFYLERLFTSDGIKEPLDRPEKYLRVVEM